MGITSRRRHLLNYFAKHAASAVFMIYLRLRRALQLGQLAGPFQLPGVNIDHANMATVPGHTVSPFDPSRSQSIPVSPPLGRVGTSVAKIGAF